MAANLINRYEEYQRRIAKRDKLRASYDKSPTPENLQRVMVSGGNLIELHQSLVTASRDVVLQLADMYSLHPMARRFRRLAVKRTMMTRAEYTNMSSPEAFLKYKQQLAEFTRYENKLLHDAMRVIRKISEVEK